MFDPLLTTQTSPSSDFSPNFDELLQALDSEFACMPSGAVGRFCFLLDEVEFEIRSVEQEGKRRFLINATIGYMPFSIESVECREAIKAIIIGSRSLPTVRFGVDTSSKISAGALFDVPYVVSPDFLFYPLALFMQEARPFIQLIGKYLVSTARRVPRATPCEEAEG